MDVARAVEILTGARAPQYRLEREFAVLAFSGWLNWPKEPYAPTNLVLLAINQALVAEQNKEGDLDARWLTQALEPKSYIAQLTVGLGGLLSVPVFEAVSGEWGYDDTRYVADIVRFLLSYRPPSRDKRESASLGKASEFINRKGGFRGRDDAGKRSRGYSDSQHQEVWKAYKRTAAFQFVRYYESEILWLFDPCDEHLLDRLTETAAKREEIQGFFSRCLWVQTRLRDLLDRRSMAKEEYFGLPDSVTPMPCRIPRLPKGVYEVMQQYTRNRAASNFLDEAAE
ncbi:hypothetical protein [Methylobacterium nigriterrae]|uniref:hypothetical protein n=1 Tax=Methylobacterium nigriterrae TaxID=3127512 RepID=UPI00301417C6